MGSRSRGNIKINGLRKLQFFEVPIKSAIAGLVASVRCRLRLCDMLKEAEYKSCFCVLDRKSPAALPVGLRYLRP